MLEAINATEEDTTTLAPSLTPVAEIVITAAGVKPRHQQAVTALLKSVVKHINCSGGMGINDGQRIRFYVLSDGSVKVERG